jgi:hypothetical protein
MVFSPIEMDLLSDCLDRLMPHVRSDSAITGGVGMQLGMARLGRLGRSLDRGHPNRLAAAIDAAIARRTAGPGSAP